MKEKEKRRGRRRRRRREEDGGAKIKANKVRNFEFCMELTLDMNSSMDHMDFVWLMTCLQI